MRFLTSSKFYPVFPIFHGWWIVLIVFLGGVVGFGIGSIGLGVFIPFMSEDLGWSRTAMSVVFTVRALMMGVSGPIVGFVADRKDQTQEGSESDTSQESRFHAQHLLFSEKLCLPENIWHLEYHDFEPGSTGGEGR